jgi:DNA-binding MarR family transcriptional regulator
MGCTVVVATTTGAITLPLDLTPFGFTPTETAAYRALTTLGPLSGYALAKALSIARANAYQALHGLVAKGAATRIGGRPERFRPVQPAALFTAITQRAARQLDALEAELSHQSEGAAATVALAGRRALAETALRLAARSHGPVTCVAPRGELLSLAPAWHKRVAADWPTDLWCLGDAPAGLGLPVPVQQVPPAVADAYFGTAVFALASPDAAVLARLVPGSETGFWTSDQLLSGAVRATIDRLIQRPALAG